MGEPDRRATVLVWALAALTIVAGACRSVTDAPPDTAPLPPQTLVAPPTPDPNAGLEAARAEARPARAPEPAPPVEAAAPEKQPTLIVIDPPETAAPEESQDLATAARREKERRRDERAPIAVINQKNLASWAEGGVLTQTAEPEEPSAAESAAVEVVEKAAVEEAYWRRRGREIRQRWHDAVDRIATLEAKAAALRNKFYSTDDGYQRDSQIKPEWDKAIADLEEARYQASRGAGEVRAFLEEGRKAGALPGWLREGVELEPQPVVETVPETGKGLEATEPLIYRDPPTAGETEEPPGA